MGLWRGGGIIGALLAVPIAAAIELIVGGLQARDRPVAQDPAAAGPDDEEHENAPDAPAPVTQGRNVVGAGTGASGTARSAESS